MLLYCYINILFFHLLFSVRIRHLDFRTTTNQHNN